MSSFLKSAKKKFSYIQKIDSANDFSITVGI